MPLTDQQAQDVLNRLASLEQLVSHHYEIMSRGYDRQSNRLTELEGKPSPTLDLAIEDQQNKRLQSLEDEVFPE